MSNATRRPSILNSRRTQPKLSASRGIIASEARSTMFWTFCRCSYQATIANKKFPHLFDFVPCTVVGRPMLFRCHDAHECTTCSALRWLEQFPCMRAHCSEVYPKHTSQTSGGDMVARPSHVIPLPQCLWAQAVMQYVLAEAVTLDGVPGGIPFGPAGRLCHGGMSSGPGGGEDKGSIGSLAPIPEVCVPLTQTQVHREPAPPELATAWLPSSTP